MISCDLALYLLGAAALSAVSADELVTMRRERPGYVPQVKEAALVVAFVVTWPVWAVWFAGRVVVVAMGGIR